ncbi:MAG: hypothetical protein KDC10_11115 [Calditrichaeota bacterium]|nr:hypothetical protein [Calditrichota bacterium]MCB9472363.1 hypothetical protein [Candidatus Delongbacteria bacterium]
MLKLPPKLAAISVLALLLIGCSSEQTNFSEESAVTLDDAQITLVQLEGLTTKGHAIDGGRRNGHGGHSGEEDDAPETDGIQVDDPDHFDLLHPDNFSFTLAADQPTSVRHNYFGFRAPAGAVSRDRDLLSRWLGPSGYYGFEMQPHGLNFEQPVDLLIDVTPLIECHFPLERLIVLLDNENGTWTVIASQPEEDPREDQSTRIMLRATLQHFSKYCIGIGPPPGGSGDH